MTEHDPHGYSSLFKGWLAACSLVGFLVILGLIVTAVNR